MIYLIFLISLVTVSKGADWLVEGAVGLARFWGISQIIIGATVVSLGTTLPETVIASLAAFQSKGDVIVGTALGSILFNTAVILGIAVVIKGASFQERDTFFKTGTMVGVLALFALLGMDLHISRFDSLLLGLILLVFLGSNIWTGIRNSKNEDGNGSKSNLFQHFLRLISGSTFVVVGAHYLLESGVEIARIFNVPEAVIAVTLFAVGSSLPELITGVTAALKGHTDLVLGNILGANTLNIIFVMSTAGLIRPFNIAPGILIGEIPWSLGIMAIIFVPAFFQREIKRWQGLLTILGYVVYLVLVLGKK